MEKKNYEGLELWQKIEKTDPKFTKKVAYGKRHFTTIDAYYQIRRATELWGSYGTTWGLKDIDISFIDVKDIKMCVLKTEFFYPNGKFPMVNSIKVSDDEFLKKIYTDTLTKSLSYLGFNSDVFMGMFDNNRYVSELKKKFASETSEAKPNKPNKAEVKPKAEPKPEPKAKPTNNNTISILEKVGIKLTKQDNFIVATGKTYPNKSLLNKYGFVWNELVPKKWAKPVAVEKKQEQVVEQESAVADGVPF